MKILHTTADVFTLPTTPSEGVIVTTNGIIRNDGNAVMGRGIALTADKKFHLAKKLGKQLKEYGNHVFDMGVYNNFHVITFPTKVHWRDDSPLWLIEQSCKELALLADNLHLTTVYCVPPGCANGHLDWETQVKPVCQRLLDDRFIMVFRTK